MMKKGNIKAWIIDVIILLLLLSIEACALISTYSFSGSLQLKKIAPQRRVHVARGRMAVSASASESLMLEGLSVFAFASTHIGMSNVRESVIKTLGETAGDAGLVGRGWQLPKSWPADSSGTNSIWPDRATAGRQIFRVLYSIVSGVTLSSACTAFAQVGQSLQNSTAESQAGMLRVDRDDSLKLRPYGLTRITRHPLVLPVVPWGLANGLVAGGRAQDLLLFWGLAAYAVCGCYAQDLRAQRSDAVGTVFEEGLLGDFYKSTSFFPALAIADGRQDLRSTLMELSGLSPWFLGGLAAGCLTEASLISLVQSL